MLVKTDRSAAGNNLRIWIVGRTHSSCIFDSLSREMDLEEESVKTPSRIREHSIHVLQVVNIYVLEGIVNRLAEEHILFDLISAI